MDNRQHDDPRECKRIRTRSRVVMAPVVGAVLIAVLASAAIAASVTWSNGWASPATRTTLNQGWLVQSSRGYHLGWDIDNRTGEPVRSIADGEVVDSNPAVGGYGPTKDSAGGVVWVRYPCTEGTYIYVMFGHVDEPRKKGAVKAGDVLGYTNSANHLHLATRKIAPTDSYRYRGYTQDPNTVYSFLDPAAVFANHHALTTPSISAFAWYSGTTAHLTVAWQKVPGASAYEVQLVRQSGSSWYLVGTWAVSGSTMGVNFRGLPWRGTYYATRVRAKASTVSGNWSDYKFVYVQ